MPRFQEMYLLRGEVVTEELAARLVDNRLVVVVRMAGVKLGVRGVLL